MTSLPLYLPGNNSANYDEQANWNGTTNGNVTSVGTNGGPSAYGTYDQSGNVHEWNDLIGTESSDRGIRGGYFAQQAFLLSSASRGVGYYPNGSNLNNLIVGFRIATFINPLNLQNFVTVYRPGNLADTTGYGNVSYIYQICSYLVTNCEYLDFLNSVAKTDTYSLYDINMGTSGGINRSGDSGNYVYSLTDTDMANKPVIYVNWFDCARYCNWLHNGKPTGNQDIYTTETGAYSLNGEGSVAKAKNNNALYWIPNENEWYKAAYYGSSDTYWLYATQSNSAPTSVTANAQGDGLLSGVLANVSNFSCNLSVPETCNKKIVRIYIPSSIITTNNTRASNIQIKIDGPNNNCCGGSNIIDLVIPSPPPPDPPNPPDKCLEGTDINISGYTAIVAYDPDACGGGHWCNRAIFDLYIDNNFIGQANLNNGDTGGPRQSTFVINNNIIVGVGTTFEIRCALTNCHRGIGRLILKNPAGDVVLAVCMPNDKIILGTDLLCPDSSTP